MNKALVDQSYLLQKFPGKGGWTYAEIPEIPPDPHAHFGWVMVRGSIDAYEISHYYLMPMGNGKLFLPVKAAIRKEIKKQAGDLVHVILYKETLAVKSPAEIEDCFKDALVWDIFESLSDVKKRSVLEWIDQSNHDETRISRILKTVDELLAIKNQT